MAPSPDSRIRDLDVLVKLFEVSDLILPRRSDFAVQGSIKHGGSNTNPGRHREKMGAAAGISKYIGNLDIAGDHKNFVLPRPNIA